MKKKILMLQFVGFVFTSVFGVLLHFLYEWSGESIIIAPFSGVNESTWEHIKLLYFPLFAYALIEMRYFKDREDYWCVKLLGISFGLVMIPVLFYTYNGAFGKSPDWLNILIFFAADGLAFLLESAIFKSNALKCKQSRLSFALLCFIGVLFLLFTFVTPEIPLFKDPITGVYGVAS